MFKNKLPKLAGLRTVGFIMMNSISKTLKVIKHSETVFLQENLSDRLAWWTKHYL